MANMLDGSLWRKALEEGTGEAQLAERIRLATRSGRPMRTADFTAALEHFLDRPLSPAKPWANCASGWALSERVYPVPVYPHTLKGFH